MSYAEICFQLAKQGIFFCLPSALVIQIPQIIREKGRSICRYFAGNDIRERIPPKLGEERANLGAFRTFVRFVLV